MAMLFTLVTTSLTALLLPMMLVQAAQVRHTTGRVDGLIAAQAGLDVALAQIRHGHADLAALPCTTIAGTVDGAAGTDRYQVTIVYLGQNPRGQTAAWLTANAMSCPPATVPAYARITAVGTAAGAGAVSPRTLGATYTFRTSSTNVLGGLIHVYPTPTSVDRCMDAGSATPAAGTVVTEQDCAGGAPQQSFGYTTDLTLVLTGSRTPARPDGLCLQAPPNDGAAVTLQPCATPRIAAQEWSFNDKSNFVGTTDGHTLNGLCITSQWAQSTGSAAGSPLVLSSSQCNAGSGDNMQNFAPDASVGAGAAGAGTHQLVNYAQFGRCLDVPAKDPTAGLLIDWPCKQAPDPSTLTWNQVWSLPSAGTGTISTYDSDNGVRYCLRSPGAVYDPAAKGPYADLVACPSTVTPADRLTWTVNADTGSYATSYTIRNADGYCLAAIGTADDYWTYGSNVSKLQVAVCGADTRQKWNAPGTLGDGRGLTDYAER